MGSPRVARNLVPRAPLVNVTGHDERVRGFTRIGDMRFLAAAFIAALPFAAQAGEYRLLVASAPRGDDPALARQRQEFAAMGRAARVRDLVLVEAVGPAGASTRARYDLPAGAFAAALVGKDGEVKLRAAHPLDAAALFPLIDSMPMRRQERRERGE